MVYNIRYSVVLLLILLFLAGAVNAAVVNATALLAPEKPVQDSMRSGTKELEKTYRIAEDLLAEGHIANANEKYGLVAKMADEPLRSEAMLKYGFTGTIREKADARAALYEVMKTSVPGSDGLELKSFARKQLNGGSQELLLAVPKGIPADTKRSPVIPDNFWDAVGSAEMMRNKGRLTEALAMYKEMQDKYPGHPVLINNVALIVLEGSSYEDVEQMIRNALNVSGADKYLDYLYDTLGQALLKQGHVIEALKYFEMAISILETPERDMHMNDALLAMNQPEAAEQFKQRARALDVRGILQPEGVK